LPIASQIAVSTPAHAQDVVRRRSRQLPAALDGDGVPADEVRLDLVVDDAHDVGEPGVLVARVRLADDALVGVHARDHRRPVRHAVVAPRVRARERDADRHGLDPGDRKPLDGLDSTERRRAEIR
jgi:hypothetical protein